MKQKKVNMYDPVKNAFREISIETAKKIIESAKKVEPQLVKLENE